ncbi:MAG: shikimate kinase, partial [Flavobacteriaceae bacterium]
SYFKHLKQTYGKGRERKTVGRILAEQLQLPFVDLDEYLTNKYGDSIPNLFLKNGEIGFRKLEKIALDELLANQKVSVLSLGGGTPCYADNMQSVLQATPHTFYLSPSVNMLCNRLFPARSKRPMISHLNTKKDLLEFISKHIFERKQFYEQANHPIYIRDESPEELVSQIVQKLG